MTDNYESPEWLMDIFRNWFDPCPLNENPEVDGLSIDWQDLTYVNPPYSNIKVWVEKAIRERDKGKTIVMLLPVDTSTQWFRMLMDAKARIFFYSGRIKFKTKGNPFFASMLIILNKND